SFQLCYNICRTHYMEDDQILSFSKTELLPFGRQCLQITIKIFGAYLHRWLLNTAS
ncbi:hypothetical protein L9F63_012385, partial [Diploptera punctata]